MNLRLYTIIKQASLLLFCLSVGIRVLIPVGYMPAAISDGWPIRLCHGSLAHALLAGHDGYHEINREEGETLSDNCSFDALSNLYGIGNEYRFHIADFEQDLTPAVHAAHLTATRAIAFRSRAPPHRNRLI